MKPIQWFLFLLIAFGTLVAVLWLAWTNHGDHAAEKYAPILLGGLTASVYAIFLVPLLAKFYLSELIAVVLAFGAEMTFFVNLPKLMKVWDGFLMLGVCALIFAPIALFTMLDSKRSKGQKLFGDSTEHPPVPPTPEQLRRAAQKRIIGNALMAWCALFIYFIIPFRWHPIFILFAINFVIALLNIHFNWKFLRETAAKSNVD